MNLFWGTPTLRAVVWLDGHLTGLSTKLVRWTGKSRHDIHPKHLAKVPGHLWYLEHIRPGDRVLDVGCGVGMALLNAAPQADLAAGFDLDLRKLRSARELQIERGVTCITLVCANAEAPLPFGQCAFDRVFLLDVIEHVGRRVEMLQQIRRLLRPEGLLLVSAPNRDNAWKRTLRAAGLPYYADADHKVEYSLDELAAELGAGGFEIAGEPQPTVLETPLAGLIDFAGGFSLGLYARLQCWKRESARRNPGEATGWRIVCTRKPGLQGELYD